MTTFKREDYVFDLPEELIAQAPPEHRGESRLLASVGSAAPVHTTFGDLRRWLNPGDVLVLNQTKVMNARCYALKDTGTRLEVFVLGIQEDPRAVPVLLRPSKRARPGTILHFPKADVRVRVVDKGEQGRATLDFKNHDALIKVLAQDGELPLPPYIRREQGPDARDQERYQTVFARDLGAVAAPTAGLHFTEALLEQLQDMGVLICRVTHHVGIGTFKPLLAEDVRDHQMEAESYHIGQDEADVLNAAKAEGRRIIAVGTTSTRCLESNYDNGFKAGSADTNHYIYPGYQFRAIDGLVTNFHLPGSSLILLVSALVGRDRIMSLYGEAVAKKYRFYSYGDAMLLIP